MANANNNALRIRAARNEDAGALASLARQLLVYEKSLNETMGDLTAWAASADELRKQMLRPANRFFVAEKDGDVIGYIKVVLHGQRLTLEELGWMRWLIDRMEEMARSFLTLALRRPRPNVEAVSGYIAGAFVHPDARRANAGRMLVAAAEDWLRTQGIATSELHVLYFNEGARRFWQEIGYEPLTLGMRKKLGNLKTED